VEEDVQRMNLEPFMRISGEDFRVDRGGELFVVEGIMIREKQKVQFRPKTDVRPGDWLIAGSGKRYYVYDTDVHIFQRKPHAIVASYRTEAEQERALDPPEATRSQVFNLYGNAYGSVFGNQQNVTLEQTFTFEELDRQIEERGGDDAEVLREMVEEIRLTLEGQDSLSRGRLVQFSELLNRHAWITGPVAQMLLLYSTTGHIG
jgi:hypothetical protein